MTHEASFQFISSAENLLLSWQEFRRGKRHKPDVQNFERHLEQNLFGLRRDLVGGQYRHGPYQDFIICDPKRRHIYKATVRDRIVHHAIYRVLYPVFDRGFIYDSYSCRLDKGTHAAVRRLETFVQRVSTNFTRPCWVLKCDVQKFFDSVDHETLLKLLWTRVLDEQTRWLLQEVVGSYQVLEREREYNKAAWYSHW